MNDTEKTRAQVLKGAKLFQAALSDGFPAYVNATKELAPLKTSLSALGGELMKWGILKKEGTLFRCDEKAVSVLNEEPAAKIAGFAAETGRISERLSAQIKGHQEGENFLQAVSDIDISFVNTEKNIPHIQTNASVAIIGTAGRKDDSKRITRALYDEMVKEAGTQLEKADIREPHLISGGAAVADHVAVSLFLEGKGENLTLHLPAEFKNGRFVENPDNGKYDPGRTANHYHRMFKERTGVDGLAEIDMAISRGAKAIVTYGFKERNTRVANDGDVLIAFTFGPGKATETFRAGGKGHRNAADAGLKDGGTADTWGKSKAKMKIHVPLAPIEERNRLQGPARRDREQSER